MRVGKSNHLNLYWRILGLFVLAIWTSALTACSAHCFLGTSHLGTTQAEGGCHTAASSSPSDGDSSDKGQPSESSPLCSSLKQLFSATALVEVPQIDCFILYTISENILLLADSSSNAIHVRQAILRDFIFTPEVYLGPALHSHAPPFLI